jgi:hypothetical protein
MAVPLAACPGTGELVVAPAAVELELKLPALSEGQMIPPLCISVRILNFAREADPGDGGVSESTFARRLGAVTRLPVIR